MKNVVQFHNYWLSFLSISLLCFTSSAFADEPAVPGQFLIKFRTTVAKSAQPTMRLRLGVSVLKQFEHTDAQLVQSFTGVQIDHKYAKELLASGVVDYIEPNYIVSTQAIPNDTQFAEQWGLHNTGQSGGTANVDIDAPDAWGVTSGSNTVVVGVVDSGINYNHPDIAPNMWVNPAETADGADSDGNGVVDDIHGFNAMNGSGNPLDDNNHGSHVAGIIGARGNNGAGIAGVNWNVKLMALKFLSSSGFGSLQGAISAIEYAISQKNRGVNIRVLNNSWGGGGYSQALRDVIAAANNAGILFVVAAGNSGNDNDIIPAYPANYDVPNVISVGAIDRNGNLASFSNYGLNTVDVAAPGVSILSTITGSGYSNLSGTSMAAPFVSGVAALALSHSPSLNTASLKSRILDNVKTLPTLNGAVSTGGIVSAKNAVGGTPPAPEPDPDEGDDDEELDPDVPPGLKIDRRNLPRVKYGRKLEKHKYDKTLGTRVLFADDGYVKANLKFHFPYFGEQFSAIAISANGRIVPLASGRPLPTTPDYSNTPLEGISPYHHDLFPLPSGNKGGVWFKTAQGVATITWMSKPYALREDSNSKRDLRIQAKLYADGRIEFVYDKAVVGNSIYDYGARATVGVFPTNGVPGNNVLVSHNTALKSTVADKKTLLFSPARARALSDVDGDGRSDLVTYKTGTWSIRTSSRDYSAAYEQVYLLGEEEDIPVMGEYDGDGKADLAVWSPSTGTYYFKLSSDDYSTVYSIAWGQLGDIPMPGDFDGDAMTDLVVYRASDGRFYALLSSSDYNRTAALRGDSAAQKVVALGGAGRDVLAGDVNGNGQDDFLIINRSSKGWAAKNLENEGVVLPVKTLGKKGNVSLVCDWDGDMKADQVNVSAANKKNLVWEIRTAAKKKITLKGIGKAGDTVMCDRDYDGDGKGDATVYRPSTGLLAARLSSKGKNTKWSLGVTSAQPQ